MWHRPVLLFRYRLEVTLCGWQDTKIQLLTCSFTRSQLWNGTCTLQSITFKRNCKLWYFFLQWNMKICGLILCAGSIQPLTALTLCGPRNIEIKFTASLLKQDHKWRILYVIWPVLYTHHHHQRHNSFSSYYCPIVSRFRCEIIVWRLFLTPR